MQLIIAYAYAEGPVDCAEIGIIMLPNQGNEADIRKSEVFLNRPIIRPGYSRLSACHVVRLKGDRKWDTSGSLTLHKPLMNNNLEFCS